MEFGLTSFAETHRDPATGRSLSHGERIRDVLAEIELAEQVGLDVYGLGEHHRVDMAASAVAVILGAAAARTKRIRLSSAVIILSSADPVRTYQDFATLDLISHGRAELLVGRGSFIESFPLFGYSLSDYDELFAEKLGLLLQIRDNETVTWSGKFRTPLDNQGIYPRAQQRPLPVWIGVGGTPASMVRAGRLGLPVALAIIGGDPARFATLVALYHRSLREAGYDPSDLPLAVHALGHVADDRDEAIEAIHPGFTETMNKIGRERGWPPLTREQFDSMAGPDGSLIVGDPDTVAAKITRWCDMLGIERFLLHTSAGNLPHVATMRSIELFGKEVVPRVRNRRSGGEPDGNDIV
jgi:probable LLM family oxidoreductase